MSQRITLPNDYKVTVSIAIVDNVSISYSFTDVSDPDDVNFWKDYFVKFSKNIGDAILSHNEIVKFSVNASAYYTDDNNDKTYEVTRTISDKILTKQNQTRDDKIDDVFDELVDPHDWHLENGEENYALKEMNSLTGCSMSFYLPEVHHGKSLSTNMRLQPNIAISNFIDFLPYNDDHLCIMHCLFRQIEKPEEKFQRKTLNDLDEYMKEFEQWFAKNELNKFYEGENFKLDMLQKLEDQLQHNICVYTVKKTESLPEDYEKLLKSVKTKYFEAVKEESETTQKLKRKYDSLLSIREKQLPELYYRSSFEHENSSNIIILPNSMFYNNNTKEYNPEVSVRTSKTRKSLEEALPFVSNINLVNTLDFNTEAHAAVLNINVFKRYDVKTDVCKYCTGTFKKGFIKEHEVNCLEVFRNIPVKERTRRYNELKNSNKEFDKYHAMYRTPFATFDFETRLDAETHMHIPYSYSILYFNIFEPSDSIIKMRVNSKNPEKLITNFLKDISDITVHHHQFVQSVDFANGKEKAKAKIPKDNICPLCKTEADKWEYNHSHFVGDNLNKHLDMYICKACNMKCTIRNKPLKFYAHNGSRFDFSLFMDQALNSKIFTNFEFLSKTESRFTQVTCALSEDTKYKIAFNDSRLLLADGLGKLSEAWITNQDKPVIKKLIDKFYGYDISDEIIGLSLKKAVFPYSALNTISETSKITDPLSTDYFYDNLYRTDISEEDYNEYINAHNSLASEFEDFNFGDYHNFYLLLDVVLLAVILYNFMNVCHDNTELNPLAFLSTSSFSFTSLLKYNKDNNVYKIIVPEVKVQKFIQKSIKGGFTMIFNKQMKDFDLNKDYSFYFDVNSLYPSVMATKKLPTEFSHWVENPSIEYMQQNENDYYMFAEVDIAPLDEEFQERVSNYPLFPENIELKKEYLSKDQLFRFKKNSAGKDYKNKTINTVTFFEKKNYTASWSYIKKALELGYKITKVHKISAFKQDYVLQGYITKMYDLKKNGSIRKDELSAISERTTTQEAELTSLKSQITVYKLILNAIYGFCIVNAERHSETDVIDIDSEEDPENLKIKKTISSVRFKSLLKVGEDKALVNMSKRAYELPYPLMIGSAILFESKLLMVDFVYTMYDWIKAKPNTEFIPLMTDTDSYVFQLKNVQQYFKSRQHLAYSFNKYCYSAFDTTGFDDEYQMPETQQAFCHMKDETNGKQILEFNGLAAKCYSIITEDFKSMIKGKGISKTLQKKFLKNELYRDVVNGKVLTEGYADNKMTVEFSQINSKRMKLYNTDSQKALVSLVDLKSYYDEGSTNHCIYGSKKHLDAVSLKK